MSDVIAIAQDEGLLRITLRDPGGGNLISNAEGERLAECLDALDPEIRAVRIESTGELFCTGRVSPMPKPGTRVSAREIATLVAEPALRVYEALRNVPVPVLAVVRGAAHGYGCALVTASDIALASERATFRVNEMERNIPPLLVLTAMHGRVPAKGAAYLAYSCAEIDAARARELGIVSEVVPHDALSARADALTATLLGYDRDAVRAIKELLRCGPGTPPGVVRSLAAHLTGTALSPRFHG